MRKHKVTPIRTIIICSLPEDLTIGVFQNQMNTHATNNTQINPMIDNSISIIPHTSDGFRYESLILIQ